MRKVSEQLLTVISKVRSLLLVSAHKTNVPNTMECVSFAAYYTVFALL